MKKIVTLIYIVFSAALLFYVALPNFEFPNSPPGFVQSNEPADMETPLRRAYFTYFTRQEVLDWYESQFNHSTFKNLALPTYLLNYPPENSGGIIRDQTKSTFLQEIVHPFRETVFINGYEPTANDDTNRIVINGVHYRQKVIVRYIPSSLLLRLVITLFTLIAIPIVCAAFIPEFIFLKKVLKSRKFF